MSYFVIFILMKLALKVIACRLRKYWNGNKRANYTNGAKRTFYKRDTQLPYDTFLLYLQTS